MPPQGTPQSAPPPDAPPPTARGGGPWPLWRAGRIAWALLGIVGVLAVAVYLITRVPLAVVPVVLALFPATLLSPLSSWLKRKGAPPALAALATMLAGILLLGILIGGMVPLVARGIPDLADSASRGLGQLERFLAGPLGVEDGASGLLERVRAQMPETGELVSRGMSAATMAVETLTGTLLLLVLVFFYLKDGPRLVGGLLSLFPAHLRPRARGVADRAWHTLGAYFRGQLLIALVDAVLIGAGLLILRVPLAIPLAVLIFFGALFPIVGAVLTGALAVLVALADGGLLVGLAVLAIVVAVQQLEGNVISPLVLGHAIHLHPVIVLLSITTGAVLLGVLGAFLAVPFVAVLFRAVSYLTGGDEDEDAHAAGPEGARGREGARPPEPEARAEG